MRGRLGVAVAMGLLQAFITVSGSRADDIEDKAAVCAGCHGEKGIPTDKNIPIIWGQQEGYLYLQLRDFKKGARQNEIMTQIASTLERDDMRALAAYFAAKPWPALGQPAASDADDESGFDGQRIDRLHRVSPRQVPGHRVGAASRRPEPRLPC